MFAWIFNNNQINKDLGLLIIRIGIGLIFAALHGFPKITGGADKWLWLGSQMKNFGITFWPIAWGLAASCAEFFGGICLIFGLGTRIAALLISCVMIVALTYHLKNGESISVYEYTMFLLIVAISLIISGGGNYSLDYYFKN